MDALTTSRPAGDRPHHRREREAPGLATQWIGLLLAPAAFFAHLQGCYVLVPRACRYHADVWLHVVGIAAVLVAAFGLLTAWRVWDATRDAEDGYGALPRARFLGATGLGVSGLLTLLLIAQWSAAFFISPCQ
jgi:uncharacterized membrane protein